MTDQSRDAAEVLARRRAEARRTGDFETADDLRAQIEAAGWKVVDSGYKFRLEPASPSASVPSRLHEQAVAPVTIVAPDAATQITVGVVPAAGHFVAVGGPPGDLPSGVEVVATQTPVRLAEAWNIGIRRSVGEVVVLLGPGVTLTGDVATPVAKTLADESVAVVGARGLISNDLRHWRAADAGEVDALDATCLAFRRADAATRGPLDERFSSARLLAIWWSLVLRDEGPEPAARRAIALDLPLLENVAAQDPDERASRRDFYRVLDRFGRRPDLLREPLRPTQA